MSLTRNFRAELKLGHSLVDAFEDALAVFSQSGVLTFSNKAYDRLWGFESNTSFADVTINDAVFLWQDLLDAIMKLEERDEWDMPICIKGRTPMQCRVVPIASGATAVWFSNQTSTIATAKEPFGKTQS